MKKEDAIKYLQQLYPNGGHCWLDEQRIEAIGMAVKALQEEPVSEDLEEAASRYAKEEYNHKSPATLPDRCIGCYAPLMYAFKAGAEWKEKRLLPMIDKICGMCQKQQDFINSKDLGGLIFTLSRRYPEVSFAKLSRIAVRVAKWQEKQDQETIELAEDHAYFAGRVKTVDDVKEKLLSEVLPCFMHGGEADEVVAKLDEVLKQK